MKCAKCGLDVPSGARQCPKCGMMNEFEPGPDLQANHKKRMIYAIAVLGAIAVVALVVAVLARGQKNLASAPPGVPGPSANVMSAPPGKPVGGNILSAPNGKPGAGAPGAPGATKLKPSAELLAYLGYVKKVEEHRQMLLKDTTNALGLSSQSGEAQGLMSMIDMAMDPDGAKARDPLQGTKDELNRQYKNWISTLDYFDKRSAPPEARAFSGSYREVLYRETKTIGEIAYSFNNVNIMNPNDMQKLLGALQKMKGDPSIQASIDKAADDADGGLTQLASQYDMKKPFDVPREAKTSPGIMGF